MVRIENKSPKEKLSDLEYETLYTVTRQMVGEENVQDVARLAFQVFAGDILARPAESIVIVGNPNRFDVALELATVYERKTNREFILKKLY